MGKYRQNVQRKFKCFTNISFSFASAVEKIRIIYMGDNGEIRGPSPQKQICKKISNNFIKNLNCKTEQSLEIFEGLTKVFRKFDQNQENTQNFQSLLRIHGEAARYRFNHFYPKFLIHPLSSSKCMVHHSVHMETS